MSKLTDDTETVKATDFAVGDRVILSRVKREQYLGKAGTVFLVFKCKDDVWVRVDGIDPDHSTSTYIASPENIDKIPAPISGGSPEAPTAPVTGTTPPLVGETSVKARSGESLVRQSVESYRNGGLVGLAEYRIWITDAEWRSIGRRLVAYGCPVLSGKLDRLSRLSAFVRDCVLGHPILLPTGQPHLDANAVRQDESTEVESRQEDAYLIANPIRPVSGGSPEVATPLMGEPVQTPLTGIADTFYANTLGMIAYARGIRCAPCLDKDMMDRLAGRQIGDPRTLPELEAWSGGWIKASLAEPLPDPEPTTTHEESETCNGTERIATQGHARPELDGNMGPERRGPQGDPVGLRPDSHAGAATLRLQEVVSRRDEGPGRDEDVRQVRDGGPGTIAQDAHTVEELIAERVAIVAEIAPLASKAATPLWLQSPALPVKSTPDDHHVTPDALREAKWDLRYFLSVQRSWAISVDAIIRASENGREAAIRAEIDEFHHFHDEDERADFIVYLRIIGSPISAFEDRPIFAWDEFMAACVSGSAIVSLKPLPPLTDDERNAMERVFLDTLDTYPAEIIHGTHDEERHQRLGSKGERIASGHRHTEGGENPPDRSDGNGVRRTGQESPEFQIEAGHQSLRAQDETPSGRDRLGLPVIDPDETILDIPLDIPLDGIQGDLTGIQAHDYDYDRHDPDGHWSPWMRPAYEPMTLEEEDAFRAFMAF